MPNVHDTIGQYGRLTLEYEDLSRPIEEEILLHQIAVQKLQEKKKSVFRDLIAEIDRLGKVAKDEVLLFGESVKIERWNFVVSNTLKVDQKRLKEDALEDEGLRKYLSESASVSIRRS